MKEKYALLIRELCGLCGLNDPDAVLESGAIVVNDVVMSLAHNDAVAPELLFIYCDFGAVPETREVEVYRAMLKTNLLLYSGSGPTFAMSFETGRVVFADYCTIADTGPEQLRDILVTLAGKADEWRSAYLGQEQEADGQCGARD